MSDAVGTLFYDHPSNRWVIHYGQAVVEITSGDVIEILHGIRWYRTRIEFDWSRQKYYPVNSDADLIEGLEARFVK